MRNKEATLFKPNYRMQLDWWDSIKKILSCIELTNCIPHHTISSLRQNQPGNKISSPLTLHGCENTIILPLYLPLSYPAFWYFFFSLIFFLLYFHNFKPKVSHLSKFLWTFVIIFFLFFFFVSSLLLFIFVDFLFLYF